MPQNYNVSDQSKESYLKFKKTGKESRYKALILKELRKSPGTRRDLAKRIRAGYPSNLCAPLKVLENEGFIKVIKLVLDRKTGREVSLYGLNDTANCLYINSNLSTCSLHSEPLETIKKGQK